MTKLQGSIIAVVTPMHINGDIDYVSLGTLIQWQLEQGCDGFVVAGSTGEAATLSFDEKLELFKFVQKIVGGQIPVIAGSGTNATHSSIDLTKVANDLGIQYSLLTCPYYNKPTQEGLFLHYQAIAQATPNMQHILYSIPGRSVIRIENDTVVRLSKISNIVGLKDSGSNSERIRFLRASCGPTFSLFSGDDDFTMECLKSGGEGVISVTANVKPREIQALVKAVLAGQIDKAESIDQTLMTLNKVLFCQSNPIPLKALMHHMGKIEKGIRLPLTWLEQKYMPLLIDAYQKVKNAYDK